MLPLPTIAAMVGRKGGLSGKQKSQLLKQARAKDAAKGSGGGKTSSATAADDSGGMRMVQQVSKKGELNALSTRFVREDDAVVQQRKLRGSEPFGPTSAAPLVYAEPPANLGLPTRPTRTAAKTSGAALEAAERAAFDTWLDSIHGAHALDALSPFEHNLDVWRQLWRCLERADVVCLVADARNPMLHTRVRVRMYTQAVCTHL